MTWRDNRTGGASSSAASAGAGRLVSTRMIGAMRSILFSVGRERVDLRRGDLCVTRYVAPLAESRQHAREVPEGDGGERDRRDRGQDHLLPVEPVTVDEAAQRFERVR